MKSLVSELGVESEDVDESRNVETLEITVGERAHVAARLDDERVVAAADALLLGRGQVLRDVAPDQVSLALKMGGDSLLILLKCNICFDVYKQKLK